MFETEILEKTPILFALSTCPRCQRMKTFLENHGIVARIIDVDLLDPSEKQKHLRFLSRINPAVSFPTLVVGESAVLGEDYRGVREVLAL